MTSWEIYWLTRLDAVNQLFFVGVLVSFGVGGLFLGIAANGYWEDNETAPKWVKAGFVQFPFVAALLLTIAAFIPTSKEMAAILVIPKIVNNEKLTQLPDRVLDLANQWIEELGPKKEEK
jgi:hypothetical protein